MQEQSEPGTRNMHKRQKRSSSGTCCVGMVLGVQGRLGQQPTLCNRHRSKFPWEHAPFKSDALDHLIPCSMLFPNVLPRPISHVKSNGWVWAYFNYLELSQSQRRMRFESALPFPLQLQVLLQPNYSISCHAGGWKSILPCKWS